MNSQNCFSRRTFLGASASAAASMCLPTRLFANTAERFGGLPIGIQSYSLRNFSVEETIRHISGLGLHYVEFFGRHFPLNSSDDKIASMKQALKAANATVSAHGVNSFGSDHDENRKKFEFAKKVGIKNITADPAPNSFDSLDKLVAEYDIRICIHNHGPGHRYDGLDSVAKAVENRHANIGACVDTGHVLRSSEDPVKWVKELGPRVFALHLKDVAEKKKKTHDVILGKAHLDVVGLFEILRTIQFPKDGSLSLEYESNPQNPIDDIRQCLIVVDESIKKIGQKTG